jgi:hypothetical protein
VSFRQLPAEALTCSHLTTGPREETLASFHYPGAHASEKVSSRRYSVALLANGPDSSWVTE